MKTSTTRRILRAGDLGISLAGQIPELFIKGVGAYLATDQFLRPIVEQKYPVATPALKWVGFGAAALYLIAAPLALLFSWLSVIVMSKILLREISARDGIKLDYALEPSSVDERTERLYRILSEDVHLQNARTVANRMAQTSKGD